MTETNQNGQTLPRVWHFALDPFCRRLRLALGEHGVRHDLVDVRPWRPDADFLALSPAGDVPVLEDVDGTVAAGIYAAAEYLEETRGTLAGGQSLLGESPAERAEARRLVMFFDHRFYAEVTAPVLMEKALKRLLPAELGAGAPDTARLRAALARLPDYLALIGDLAERRGLLAGNRPTLADLAAAAHLSVLEYLDALRFGRQEAAKTWYQRIKSRPSFRPLLADRVGGIVPPAAYVELDF